MDERIDIRCSPVVCHVIRMQNDRIAKTVYVGEGVGIRSVRRQRNRGLGTLKDCLKKYKKKMFGCQTSKENSV